MNVQQMNCVPDAYSSCRQIGKSNSARRYSVQLMFLRAIMCSITIINYTAQDARM